MTKEEIRIKWIRHTPLLSLDECVDNAMDEYAKKLEFDNTNEILKLRIEKRDCQGSYQKLKQLADEMANSLTPGTSVCKQIESLKKYKQLKK